MAQELGIGSRVRHEKYGEGIVSKVGVTAYEIFFRRDGDKEISKEYEGLEIIEANPPAEGALTLDDVERSLVTILQRFADFTLIVPLGDRWIRGKLILEPGREGQQPKELPIENFFHKIVMVRDRLRVLEQNINSSKTLNDEEKVHLQQYITRCYGSLTTFNILFKDSKDHFRSK